MITARELLYYIIINISALTNKYLYVLVGNPINEFGIKSIVVKSVLDCAC